MPTHEPDEERQIVRQADVHGEPCPSPPSDSTMMAPTERSMPAVRMMSVWAMPNDADDRDLLDDQRQVEGMQEAMADDDAEEDDGEQQDEERDRSSGWLCRKCCSRRSGRSAPPPRQERPAPWRQRRPDRAACRGASSVIPSMADGEEGRHRAALPPQLSLGFRVCAISPSTSSGPSVVIRDGTPATGLSVISVDAGVEEVQARRRLRLLAGLGEFGDRLDAHARPSAAGIAARSRR